MSAITSLLNKAGVEYHDKREEIMIDCPFCEEYGYTPDTHFCLGINKLKFVAHCLRCDWAANGLSTMLKAFSRKWGVPFSYREMLKDMKEEYEPPIHLPEPIGLPVGYERFLGTDDEWERKARRYLKSRGLGKLEIAQYRIGYAATGEMAGRVIFPVLWDGQIYGYVGRAFVEGLKPKYLNSKGIKMLWGAHLHCKAIGLGEGVMDALAVRQALYDCDITGASTLGCGMDAFQVTQLRQFQAHYLFPDWDEAGIKEAISTCRRAAQDGIIFKVAIPHRLDGSDPGSLGPEVLRQLYLEAKPWSRTTEFRLRKSRRRPE